MSQDRLGLEHGVARQEAECRKLAKKLGLTVVRVYSDNDVSATSGAYRTGFEEMLAERPEAILTWHQDRLLRLTRELERVIDLDIPVYMVESGSLDLSNPAGRAVARTVAAWSQYEIEQKALRQVASNKQRVMSGHWQFSLRPYGYRRVGGKVVVVEEEAEVIREGYRRVIAGETYYAIAKDWNARGIKPLLNDEWKPGRVGRLLENNHYAGIVTYKGEVLEGVDPDWEALITPREWADFHALRINRKRQRSWATTPKHLLSGLMSCGICGALMFSHGQLVKRPVMGPDGPTRPMQMQYVCFGKWCTSIRAVSADLLVETSLLAYLNDPRIVTALKETTDTAPLESKLLELTTNRDNLIEMIGEGLISKIDARAKLADLNARIERLVARLDAIRTESPLTDLLMTESVSAKWQGLPILEKRRIFNDLGLRLTIHPAVHGKRGIDPATGAVYTERAWTMRRIQVEWPLG